MSQNTEFLEERLRAITAEWEAAKEAAQAAKEKEETLSVAVDAYRKALAYERRGKKIPLPAAKAEPPEQLSLDESLASDTNKSLIARELILANAERGVTPKDVRDAFKKAGVSFHANYPYAVLRRFMKNKTIKKMRGKYYPMESKKIGE